MSLTFDDTLADQSTAAQLLAAHGMHGTFFVNSGRIGRKSFLSLDQIRSFEAAGNEIGSHTVDHKNLTTLTPEEQRHEICDDVAALTGDGLTVTALAYPYGAATSEAPGIARGCGILSARSSGGIGSCADRCPPAESLPPQDLMYTRTAPSIKADITPSTVEGYVTNAEEHGGGWVQLVFHHLCDNACTPYSMSEADFTTLVDWLDRERDSGLRVLTVSEALASGASASPTGTLNGDEYAPSPPGVGTFGPAVPTTVAEPPLRVVARHRVHVADIVEGKVRVAVACASACTVRARLTLTRLAARRLLLRHTAHSPLAHAEAALGGGSARLVLRPTHLARSLADAVARRRRMPAVALRLRVTASDASSAVRTSSSVLLGLTR